MLKSASSAKFWFFLALAKQVPDESDALVPNPHATWRDVDASLPEQRIVVLGPPPTSGTRDAFNELALEGGCNTFPELAALKDSDPEKHKQVCLSIREDGAFIEAGENDNLIVQKLLANTGAVGVFGYSFLEQNLDKLRGAKVDGVEPSFDQIASKAYPVSRLLYIYVKKAHVGSIPGIREYVAEFTSEKAVGDFGYLTEKGLIPMPAAPEIPYHLTGKIRFASLTDAQYSATEISARNASFVIPACV